MVIAATNSKDIKISFCVTCKDRGEFAKITLKENLKFIRNHPNREIVFLDYNSDDGIGDHIKRYYRKDIENGNITYAKNPDVEKFHMTHAKNQAHAVALLHGKFAGTIKNHIVCNLDADNFLTEKFCRSIEQHFSNKPKSYMCADAVMAKMQNINQAEMGQGTGGRLALPAALFITTGGYDEKHNNGGWGYDETQFVRRIFKELLAMPNIFDPKELKSIPHSDELRLEYMKGTPQYDVSKAIMERKPTPNIIMKAVKLLSREYDLLSKSVYANPDGFGIGRVLVGIDSAQKHITGYSIDNLHEQVTMAKWGLKIAAEKGQTVENHL